MHEVTSHMVLLWDPLRLQTALQSSAGAEYLLEL